MDVKLEHVYTAFGRLSAEMIRTFLESNGIQAIIMQESAGSTFGLTVGPLGEVKVYVDEQVAGLAREVLAAMERGEYEQAGDSGMDDPGSDSIDPSGID